MWWRECAGAALLLAALLALVAADDKRSDMSPMPFVMGSRYGRSAGPRLIAPRNDRFFMGSRYGKRSGAPLSSAPLSSARLAAGGAGERRALLCEFTGVAPLYRCVRRDRYDKRSSDESAPEEE